MILENSIKISNYKCFGEVSQGFERICPINLIIGKNNSGKSSLLDIIEFLTNPNSTILDAQRNGKESEVIISNIINENTISLIFPSSISGGGIPGNSYYEYGKRFLNSKIEYIVKKGDSKVLKSVDKEYVSDAASYFKNIPNYVEQPILPQNQFIRINAERDILSEPVSINPPILESNGIGATNLIQVIINNINYDSRIIEKDLLNELNSIVNPELEFIDIVVQIDEKNWWEIYLEEKVNGRIPLSKMGSGIKTILLVLLSLIVIPKIRRIDVSECIFGFEELENNLHPSLQRKLFAFLIDYSVNHGCKFFITTHSSLAIDLFTQNSSTQILHISKGPDSSLVSTLPTNSSGVAILKDLGFKSSDLLLSNGIVWVEGPSDAIYIELFLNLFCKENQKKNLARLNFTIQSLSTSIWKYAGFSDAEINFEETDIQNKIISLTKINHNHLLVIDGDYNYEDISPSKWDSFQNGTGQNKAKLINESLKFSGYSESDLLNNFGFSKDNTLYFWITEGTFESYLKHFVSKFGKDYFSKYFDFKEKRGYFEKKKEGSNSAISKVELAYQIAKFITDGNLKFSDIVPENSQLSDYILRLYNTIKNCWN